MQSVERPLQWWRGSQNAILRYSRLQICVTKAGAKTHAQLRGYDKLSRAELELCAPVQGAWLLKQAIEFWRWAERVDDDEFIADGRHGQENVVPRSQG